MSWLAVTLWGGLVGLDATSLLQVMISRPIVAAPVTGVLLGRPLAGVAVGVLLEIFALVILPIGAARYPESGTAAVAATAAYAGTAGPAQQPELLLVAVVFGLIWERVGGASVTSMRRVNERLMVGPHEATPLTAARLERLHLTALAIDFLRGAVVTVSGAVLAGLLLLAMRGHWAIDSASVTGMLGVGGAAMIGAALSLFDGWSERKLAFVIGVLCGLTLLLVT